MLIGIGGYFTIKLKFAQFTFLGHMIKLLGEGFSSKEGGKGVSSFQAFCISTASRVGTGNLAGVAIAIVTGGPGAVSCTEEYDGSTWTAEQNLDLMFRLFKSSFSTATTIAQFKVQPPAANTAYDLLHLIVGDLNIANTSLNYQFSSVVDATGATADFKAIIPQEDYLLKNPQCKQIESCSNSLSKKCICPKEPNEDEHYLDSYGVTKSEFLTWNELVKEAGSQEELINLIKSDAKISLMVREAMRNNCKKEEPKQETLEEFIFKVPFDYNIKPKEVIDMCMKEQENIILTFRLGNFIDMINSLSDDTEKNRILKSVFNNREGELLLESYKSMKLHYEK
jgi:hypothetical protein